MDLMDGSMNELKSLVDDLDDMTETTDGYLKERNENIPGGFSKFLRTSYVTARKLAIPVIMVGASAGALAVGVGVAAPIVGVATNSLGVGVTMIRNYRKMPKNTPSSNLKITSKSLDEKMEDLHIKNEDLTASVVKNVASMYSSGLAIEKKS